MADLPSKEMVYISNRPKGEAATVHDVHPGIHVLANAKLDSPWPKAQRLEQNFKELLGTYGEGSIPHICSQDWESSLSSIFVEMDTPLGRFGTRSTAALTIEATGQASLYEMYLDREMWKEHTVNYHIEKKK